MSVIRHTEEYFRLVVLKKFVLGINMNIGVQNGLMRKEMNYCHQENDLSRYGLIWSCKREKRNYSESSNIIQFHTEVNMQDSENVSIFS